MALGKGLGAILEEVGQAYENELGEKGATPEIEGAVREIELERIEPNPYQPRRHFDEDRLRELSESIRRHGLLQPVVVVSAGDRYILVAGERRLRAHKMAGLPTIRSIVADLPFDELRMRELALVENIQREDLNPVELARSYKELLDVHGITHEALAEIVHKSRSQITNTLRLLSLGADATNALIEGKISQGHAKILVGLPEKDQKIMVDTIIGRRLSVRELEAALRASGPAGKRRSAAGGKGFEIDRAHKKELAELLPFPHRIKKDSVEIRFDDARSLADFLELLKKGRQTPAG